MVKYLNPADIAKILVVGLVAIYGYNWAMGKVAPQFKI